MLTGDVGISYGRARICSFDVDVNRDQARKHFGYCPQEDGVDPLLNGFEQLELYGKLRGLSVADTKAVSATLVQQLFSNVGRKYRIKILLIITRRVKSW